MWCVNRFHWKEMFWTRWMTISLSRMTLLHKVVFGNYSPKIQYFTQNVLQPPIIFLRCQAACWQLPLWHAVQCHTQADSRISGGQCQVFFTMKLDFLPRAEYLALLVDKTPLSLVFLPVLHWLSVPHYPSTSVYVRQYQTTSVSVSTNHQRSILTFTHLQSTVRILWPSTLSVVASGAISNFCCKL
jgi:hypothetical protein